MFGLNNKAVGVIIDDRSLEIVELKKSGARTRLLNFSRKILPHGLVVNGVLQNGPALRTIVTKALAEAKPQGIKTKKIVFALPENQSYFLATTLPPTESDNTDDVIKEIVSESFPLDSQDLVFDFNLIQKSKQDAEIFLRVGSQRVLSSWQSFWLELGLEIDIFDTEFFALARDLVLLDPKAPVCLIDIGAVKTNIFIWQNGLIYYSSVLGVGGNFFTKAIAEKFKLTMVTAERKKMQLGLSRQILPLLIKQLRAVVNETETAINYYQNSYGVAVKEVVLLGGSSRLKGLTEFFRETLTLPVSLAKLKSLPDKFPLEYYGAIGAAWRGLNAKRFAEQPDFNSLLKKDFFKTNVKLAPIMVKTKTKTAEPVTVVDQTISTKLPLSSTVNDNEDLASLETEEESLLADKINKEKKILLMILVLGLVLLLGAFWYRNQEKNKQALERSRYQSVSYDQVQTFSFKLPVTISNDSLPQGTISGRIIETVINSGSDFDSVLAEAMAKAKYNLKENEVLWTEPLNEIVDRQNLLFPLTFRWLAYGQKEAMKIALIKIDELNSQKTDYSFNKLEAKSLEKTDKTDLLYLLLDVTISSNKKIVAATNPLVIPEPTQTTQILLASSTSTSSEPKASSDEALIGVSQVLILTTETGWLNIREGPGANFAVVKKVTPGKTYEKLEEQGTWTKIKLEDGQTGWGASRYMRQQ